MTRAGSFFLSEDRECRPGKSKNLFKLAGVYQGGYFLWFKGLARYCNQFRQFVHLSGGSTIKNCLKFGVPPGKV